MKFNWEVNVIFQDSIDLFLGRYTVEDGEGVTRPCSLDVEKGWKYITVSTVTHLWNFYFSTLKLFPWSLDWYIIQFCFIQCASFCGVDHILYLLPQEHWVVSWTPSSMDMDWTPLCNKVFFHSANHLLAGYKFRYLDTKCFLEWATVFCSEKTTTTKHQIPMRCFFSDCVDLQQCVVLRVCPSRDNESHPGALLPTSSW
jgi:hypothetical protein